MSVLIKNLRKSHKSRLWLSFKLKHHVKLNRILIRTLSNINQTKTCSPVYIPKNVVFFGTDEFALMSLKTLLLRRQEGSIDKLHVVTKVQRKPLPAVPKLCIESNVPFDEWPLKIPLQGFDIGIVVSFGHLIPLSIIESFPLGIMNVHGSLLPRWRGSSPIIHAVLNGDKEIGITIMKIHPYKYEVSDRAGVAIGSATLVDFGVITPDNIQNVIDKFDVGEIVYQEKMTIESEMKSLALTHTMAVLGAKCLAHCLDNIRTLFLESKSQPSTGITIAPKIKTSDSEIIWEKMTPNLIHSMFLAYDDYYPLWSNWHGKKVKLKELSNWRNETEGTFHQGRGNVYHYIKKLRLTHLNESTDVTRKDVVISNGAFNVSGQVLYKKREKVLRIKCLHGFVEFNKIAVQGKKTMSALEFFNGFLSKVSFSERFFQ